MTYNGENQGVFNSNGTYFYMHELMESYIGWSMCGQITHSGFFRTHIDGILKTMDLHALQGDSIWRVLLVRPYAVERFVRAMFDFITLQKINYCDLYPCQCAFKNHSIHKLLEQLQITVTSAHIQVLMTILGAHQPLPNHMLMLFKLFCLMVHTTPTLTASVQGFQVTAVILMCSAHNISSPTLSECSRYMTMRARPRSPASNVSPGS